MKSPLSKPRRRQFRWQRTDRYQRVRGRIEEVRDRHLWSLQLADPVLALGWQCEERPRCAEYLVELRLGTRWPPDRKSLSRGRLRVAAIQIREASRPLQRDRDREAWLPVCREEIVE